MRKIHTYLAVIILSLVAWSSQASSADEFESLPQQVLKPKMREIPTAQQYNINAKYLRKHLAKDVILLEPIGGAKKEVQNYHARKQAKKQKQAQAEDQEQVKELAHKTAIASQIPFTTVHGFLDQHIIGYTGVKLFAKNLPDSTNNEYLFVKQGKTFTHPLTEEELGINYRILGKARLISSKPSANDVNKLATLEIIKADQAIEKDEIIIPSPFLELPNLQDNVSGRAYQGSDVGFILATTDGIWDMSQYDSVVISMGTRENLQQGDVLGVYRADKQDLLSGIQGHLAPRTQQVNIVLPKDVPFIKQGELMVYKAFDKVSLAVVLKAITPMTINDIVKKVAE